MSSQNLAKRREIWYDRGMNFEIIEEAYDLLLDNIQTLQNQLGTNFYDALIEQNAGYLAGVQDAHLQANNQTVKDLHLSQEEWRRVFQFLLIKANQTEPLQYNHQFTPDSIGFLLTFLLDELVSKQEVAVLEIGSGTGNLAQTIVHNSQKTIDYLGIEVDDLLIDMSASIAEVMDSKTSFAQGDAVRPQILKESDAIISDLPIGFYPDDAIAKRYQVASSTEHTYAHHLLMEQSLKYLSQDGIAIFLAPNNLLTSPQSELLKEWMKNQTQLLAMIALPEDLFGAKHMAKSIFVFQKSLDRQVQTLVAPIRSLQDPEGMKEFVDQFKKWKTNHAF